MNTLKKKLSRIIQKKEESPLPVTYEAVEFIQAYGLAYIDTGITSSENTKIEIECCALDNLTPSDQHSRVMLIAGSTASQMIAVYPNAGGSEMNIRFGSSWVPSSAVVNIYEKIKVTFDNSSLTVEQNGVSTTDTYTAGTIDPNTIYLFKVAYNSNYWATGRVYSLKIWDGQTLVRDMVPCYRKTDRELGMYDFVSATFFRNAGMGSFRAKYLDFPTGYTQCDYIQSSRAQAINMNFKFSNKHRIDMNMMPLSGSSGNVQGFFGAWDGTNNTYIGKGNANTWRLYYAHGSSSYQTYIDMTSEAAFNTLKAICADRTSNFYINASSETLTNHTYTNGATCYMFARHNKNSSLDEPAIFAGIRMYNCVVYYNGSKYRTYEPCYRTSDNVPGLYDLNNDVFYPSFTGTDFTKGSDL